MKKLSGEQFAKKYETGYHFEFDSSIQHKGTHLGFSHMRIPCDKFIFFPDIRSITFDIGEVDTGEYFDTGYLDIDEVTYIEVAENDNDSMGYALIHSERGEYLFKFWKVDGSHDLNCERSACSKCSVLCNLMCRLCAENVFMRCAMLEKLNLTVSQQEVISLIIDGFSVADIAFIRNVSERSVLSCIGNIQEKERQCPFFDNL